jgi:hypothetical protein
VRPLERDEIGIVGERGSEGRAIARIPSVDHLLMNTTDGALIGGSLRCRLRIHSSVPLAGCGKIRLSFRSGPSGPSPEPKNTGQALVSQAGVHGFRVPSLRSGPGMTAIWAIFSSLLGEESN